MNRVDHPCPGDCARCGLLADGKVDMIPCVLDQLFRRVQKMESSINQLKDLQTPAEQNVAALGHNEEKYVQEDDGAGSQRRRCQRKDDVAEH